MRRGYLPQSRSRRRANPPLHWTAAAASERPHVLQRNPSQVIDEVRRRDFRASALAFYGFAVIVAIDIALAAAFNPDRGETGFWIMLAVIFGGLLVWSLWIARRLRKGKGVVAAYSLLGILTGLVRLPRTSIRLVGGRGLLAARQFPG